MNRPEFRKLIRECIEEIILETLGSSGNKKVLNKNTMNEWIGGTPPQKVKPERGVPLYIKPTEPINPDDETDAFTVNDKKVKLVNAIYPDGKKELGVYVIGTDPHKVYSIPYFKYWNNIVPENTETDDPLYVEYVKELPGEEPFMLHGKKFQYVWAKYPGGKIDIGVYAYSGDMVYGYNVFRKMFNLPEGIQERVKKLSEMTGTSAVQGFYGKNWVDPDPKRKRMKDIAKKSVGGNLA